MILIAALILSIIAIFTLIGVSLLKEHKRILEEIDDENDF